jgi:hypothetical protein
MATKSTTKTRTLSNTTNTNVTEPCYLLDWLPPEMWNILYEYLWPIDTTDEEIDLFNVVHLAMP